MWSCDATRPIDDPDVRHDAPAHLELLISVELGLLDLVLRHVSALVQMLGLVILQGRRGSIERRTRQKMMLAWRIDALTTA